MDTRENQQEIIQRVMRTQKVSYGIALALANAEIKLRNQVDPEQAQAVRTLALRTF